MHCSSPQSPKILDGTSSRPNPLPKKVGTSASSGTIPIKPLVNKLSMPAAFTKPCATVTPTLKSAATTVRPIVFTTTSIKTVSTCTIAPATIPIPQYKNVMKGEASSSTCSPPIPDTVLPEVSSSTASISPQETDSDPNVTSTTNIESQKNFKTNKMVLKQKNDLKDFLIATATIRKEQEKKTDVVKENKSVNKRSSSFIDSLFDDSQHVSKVPKLSYDCKTEVKKVKNDVMKPRGRIPKLKKEENRERVEIVKSLDGIEEKRNALIKLESRSMSKHDDRNKEKLKKKKKVRKKDNEESHTRSTDEDKRHKKMRKGQDLKLRD